MYDYKTVVFSRSQKRESKFTIQNLLLTSHTFFSGQVKISDILEPQYIVVGLAGSTKDETIEQLIRVATKNPRVKNAEKVHEAIFAREKIMSTGVGKGFAIPHAKTSAVSDIVAAFGITAAPVDYNAYDHEPVRLLFLIVGKEDSVSQHLKLLSRASRLMSRDGFRATLLAAKTSEEVLTIFRDEEATLSDS